VCRATPRAAATSQPSRVLEHRRAVALAQHFREAEGLSINQIADRLGCSSATVKAWSRGLTRASGERAFRKMQEVQELRPSRPRDVEAVTAVLRAIPDEVVERAPAPTRRGRPGPAPPPPPEVLGPVLRVLILAAAITGLRQ
jgi:DNA-binding transcriptional regulator YiaG